MCRIRYVIHMSVKSYRKKPHIHVRICAYTRHGDISLQSAQSSTRDSESIFPYQTTGRFPDLQIITYHRLPDSLSDCAMHTDDTLPAYSDEFVQDLHLFPFYPLSSLFPDITLRNRMPDMNPVWLSDIAAPTVSLFNLQFRRGKYIPFVQTVYNTTIMLNKIQAIFFPEPVHL